MPKNNIIPQMFDVRPVKKTGDLDWDRIKRVEENYPKRKQKIKTATLVKPKIFVLGQKIESHKLPVFSAPSEFYFAPEKKEKKEIRKEIVERIIESRAFVPRRTRARKSHLPAVRKFSAGFFQKLRKFFEILSIVVSWPFVAIMFAVKWQWKAIRIIVRQIARAGHKIAVWPGVAAKTVSNFFQTIFPSKRDFSFSLARSFSFFAAGSLLIVLTVGSAAFWSKGVFIKGKVLGVSEDGFANINVAIENLREQNFDGSISGFNEANLKFSEASKELEKMGNFLIESSRFFPFVSQLSSGKNTIDGGKYLALAAKDMVETAKLADNFSQADGLGESSLLDLLSAVEKNLREAKENLKKANESISKVNVDDLPDDKKEKFLLLRSNLPSAILAVETFLENGHILNDLLGGNGPRKFLFLFQNNQEMRPTGGFIGSYGLLDISSGRIRNFFIDGIFNPDGQLKEKVVPPLPIQKISAAWSMHDSNWFPDFPTSAEEAAVFYEKTGGPTADGVITLTPTVMEKFLEITGPIEMKEYGVILDSENFVEKTQYEVEADYDKEENEPKKILSDLAPMILDKLFSTRDLGMIVKTLDVMVEALNQKHILIYSRNEELQKMISKEGWSGEVLFSQKDYLSVINTNINGFKTDGVIDEEISHEAEIQSDGTIVDTATITRRHNGGSTGYDWWDRVNADYMRVYVPSGSKFLSVEGQTREVNESPLDYDALGFKRNERVEREEGGMIFDENSGTRIYEDFGKTVFANWVYVSPKESTTVKYRYELPFKMDFENSEKMAESYSLLAQKQSGSLGSLFSSKISFPRKFKAVWKYSDDGQESESEIQWKADLSRDRFWGVIFTEKNLIINQ